MSFYDTGDLSGKSEFDVQVESVEAKSFFTIVTHFEQVVRKAMVSSVDEAVGNIIETLEATGAVQGIRFKALDNALAREMTIWQHKWQWRYFHSNTIAA